MATHSYSRAEIVDGTGWDKAVRFVNAEVAEKQAALLLRIADQLEKWAVDEVGGLES